MALLWKPPFGAFIFQTEPVSSVFCTEHPQCWFFFSGAPVIGGVAHALFQKLFTCQRLCCDTLPFTKHYNWHQPWHLSNFFRLILQRVSCAFGPELYKCLVRFIFRNRPITNLQDPGLYVCFIPYIMYTNFPFSSYYSTNLVRVANVTMLIGQWQEYFRLSLFLTKFTDGKLCSQ